METELIEKYVEEGNLAGIKEFVEKGATIHVGNEYAWCWLGGIGKFTSAWELHRAQHIVKKPSSLSYKRFAFYIFILTRGFADDEPIYRMNCMGGVRHGRMRVRACAKHRIAPRGAQATGLAIGHCFLQAIPI